MRTAAIALFLLALLGIIAMLALGAWDLIGNVQISRQGLIALGLGVGISVLLGAGLMTLMFFSSRRGYDDRAHEVEQVATDPGPDPAQES